MTDIDKIYECVHNLSWCVQKYEKIFRNSTILCSPQIFDDKCVLLQRRYSKIILNIIFKNTPYKMIMENANTITFLHFPGIHQGNFTAHHINSSISKQ